MTAGEIWLRPDGLRWVEVQSEAVEPSGWRVMVPLVEPADAPEAPPLVVAVADWHARVHLFTTAHHDELGTVEDRLVDPDLALLRDAISTLIREP